MIVPILPLHLPVTQRLMSLGSRLGLAWVSKLCVQVQTAALRVVTIASYFSLPVVSQSAGFGAGNPPLPPHGPHVDVCCDRPPSQTDPPVNSPVEWQFRQCAMNVLPKHRRQDLPDMSASSAASGV